MTIMEDVAALKGRVEQAQRNKARAEGARDSAQTALDKARQELADDFGVRTMDDADRLLSELRDDLARMIAEISAKLDQIGI
jgi:uncharacterized protein (DUF3084 family)